MKDMYAIKCSKGYVSYVDTFDGETEYGFIDEIKYSKAYSKNSINRALKNFKIKTGLLDAKKVKIDMDKYFGTLDQ